MKVVDRLVIKLIEDGAIEEEDREIYEYGFHHGIILIINIMCTLLIGILMKMFWEVLIFMIAYIPIRTNAGGFHAKTQLRCFFYSNLFVVGILECAKVLAGHIVVLLMFALTASLTIVLLAPVEDQNKPLDDDEVRVYGKKAKIILVFVLLGACILKAIKYETGCATVVLSIFGLAIFLIMGYIKNIIIKRRRKEEV